ncbi:MAG: Cytochrome C oxidase subunit III [uncultured Campylobacterales bacterium]|uniref:Cytochrome C oxidase subunit III n=1 Tax=uncultured Campylobacterales bacterium TaxID=352960 RepID=A0A6S6TBA1_9BACT|nr:MAG: Cytochrome C oxidase subunit III [uncultured Campylobacterales bacterium]
MTKFEYASMLYKNPRSIGCDKCHGNLGEKTLITEYKHKGIQKQLYAPDITKISFENFKKVFSKNTKIMPKYFFTDKEIQELYYYIQEVNK